jgi:hypothetical protein
MRDGSTYHRPVLFDLPLFRLGSCYPFPRLIRETTKSSKPSGQKSMTAVQWDRAEAPYRLRHDYFRKDVGSYNHSPVRWRRLHIPVEHYVRGTHNRTRESETRQVYDRPTV